MHWYGGGLIQILNYASNAGAAVEVFAILTESGLDILTESGLELLTESE